MKKKKIQLKNIIGFGVVLVIIGVLYFYFDGSTLGSNLSSTIGNFNNLNSKHSDKMGAKNVTCTRTTRLENQPQYDRALSLIEERYKQWEETGETKGSWYFFPSQLVNCIKILEGDVRNTSGVEGYFTFNDPEIKENYFPITVDADYSSTDDVVTALLLVHEIVHVQQYLDYLHNTIESSCIDKETEAFYAQIRFYSIQNTEIRKSIDLRIEHDENLNPQLGIISAIKNQSDLDGVRNECLYGSGKDDKNCIDNYRKNEIKKMIAQDEYYQRQCATKLKNP